MADAFLINQANGQFARIRAVDTGGGVLVPQVGGLGSMVVPGGVLRTGQRLMLPVYAVPIKTNAIAADTMYAYPIPVPVNTLLSGVAVQVGTAVAATLAKFGAALPGADGLPDALLGECPTPQDMNSGTDAELVASFSSAVSVPAGFVWGLFVANGAAQPFTVAPFNYQNQALAQVLGGTAMSHFTLQGGTGATIRVSRAHPYANAFPANLTGWSRANAVPSSPIMAGVVA